MREQLRVLFRDIDFSYLETSTKRQVTRAKSCNYTVSSRGEVKAVDEATFWEHVLNEWEPFVHNLVNLFYTFVSEQWLRDTGKNILLDAAKLHVLCLLRWREDTELGAAVDQVALDGSTLSNLHVTMRENRQSA